VLESAISLNIPLPEKGVACTHTTIVFLS